MFADLKRGAESNDDLHVRLLTASELHNIDPSRNEKYDVCARARNLQEAGFIFTKDGDEDEVPEHY